MTQARANRYLQALSDLEKDATPTEAAFFNKQRTKFEKQLAIPETEEEELTAEEIASHVTAGYEGLFWYQYQRSKPDIDQYWEAYLDKQIEARKAGLKDFEEQLATMSYSYTAPQYDPEALKDEEESDLLQEKEIETQHLQRLLSIWKEKGNTE